jgi:hypothetical protein
MKKLFVVLMFLLLLAMPLYASQVRETLIATTTLDADPTTTNGATYIGDCDKVAFFVTYDETEVGASVSVAVTMQISYDGTTYQSASFYDYAGGATLQTSETISGDGSYYCWFNPDLTVPYVKLILTATNTDADDIAAVTGYIVKLK